MKCINCFQGNNTRKQARRWDNSIHLEGRKHQSMVRCYYGYRGDGRAGRNSMIFDLYGLLGVFGCFRGYAGMGDRAKCDYRWLWPVKLAGTGLGVCVV